MISLYRIAHHGFADLEGYTVAKRSVFVLDEQGKLTYRWISDDRGREPNYGGIMSILGEGG